MKQSLYRYFIKLAYCGTGYHGWQIQQNAITVQEKLNSALSTILRQDVKATGAGRTDTGVHASEYFAHFDVLQKIDDIASLVYKLNSLLPKDIAVYDVFPVNKEAHARFDAVWRTYVYVITQVKDPFKIDLAYYFPNSVNLDDLNKSCHTLYQYEDFSSFSKSNTQVKTFNCKIKEAVWEKESDLLTFKITADRFLRNMVRAIVGTMLDIGTGKLPVAGLSEIIESRDRANAGESVPGCGLYLTNILYPEDIFRSSAGLKNQN